MVCAALFAVAWLAFAPATFDWHAVAAVLLIFISLFIHRTIVFEGGRLWERLDARGLGAPAKPIALEDKRAGSSVTPLPEISGPGD